MVPGEPVIVHGPVSGRPPRLTMPVAIVHVGLVVMPGTGACGVTGWGSIVTGSDGSEVHPEEFVTVKVYVPASSPSIVEFVPVPLLVSPEVIVSVQVPVPGRLPIKTLPVAVVHEG